MDILNWLWRVEICKSGFVWRLLWNPEIRYFLALQPVFVKCLLCALYWTRCKPPSVSFGFCSISSDFCIIFLMILNLYESYTTENDSWLHYSNMFLSFTVILQVYVAPLRSESLTYFRKPCKNLQKYWKNQTSCWHYHVSCLSK